MTDSKTAQTREQAPQASAHYDATYFAWQESHGEIGGWAKLDKYRRSVRPTDRALDFGCGGGALMANLACAGRYGIEPNPAARTAAAAKGVTVFESAAEALRAIGPEHIDTIISDNALEHALEPWRELSALRPLLKRGGLLHIVVPCEGIGWKFRDDDINQHLYSWGPQSLGNLVKAAGFDVVSCRPYINKWPPRITRQIAKLGWPIFNMASTIWGHIDRRWFQVEVIAKRPMNDRD